MKSLYLHRSVMLLAAMLFFVHFGLHSASGFQGADARDGGKPTATPTPKRTPPKGTSAPPVNNPGGGRTVKPPSAPVTNMTVIIPQGCRIWLNEVPVETSLIQDMVLSINGYKVKTSERAAGVITLKGIKPGTYRLVARKPDFREYAAPVTVTLDGENVVTVRLTPIPGTLTVAPSIGGGEIEIVNVETNVTVGRYPERVNEFELAPGQYRVVTSKVGYRVATREIRVRPGESVYLEPFLEPLPPPTPSPKPSPAFKPLSFNVQRQDKYLLFYLQGSSGDSAQTVGTITVTVKGPASNTVTGNLNGLPCRIEVIKLENIAEVSVVEAPGPSNNWTSIVLRVRPKDEKRRPIGFSINWRSLPNAPALKIDTRASAVIPAQAIRRVQPEYPLVARGSNVGGSVLVTVTIDTEGSVSSAKALEGPAVLRRAAEDAARKWKFRPATHDGHVIESEQIIEFRFEPSRQN